MLIKQTPGKQIKIGLVSLPIIFVLWVIVNVVGLGKGEADRNFNSSIFGRFLSVLVVMLYVLGVLAIVLIAIGLLRLVGSCFTGRSKPPSLDSTTSSPPAQTPSVAASQTEPTDRQV